jgi:signal transduction histidine kinase
MTYHGTGVGVLAAFDRGEQGEPFTAEDEQLLRTFAASAANAVAISRSVETERLRATVDAADAERARWARELHDETLQALGALRVGLAGALRRDDAENRERAMRQAIEEIELEISNLRAIISDLRPSLLDDLGLGPAIEALLERRAEAGVTIISELNLPTEEEGGPHLDPAIETTAYRLIQEALTNVIKHSHARTVRISATIEGDELAITVQDDGTGFDVSSPSSGFGLAGMRERVFLAGGSLELTSDETGTLVNARLRTTLSSSVDQVAS